MLASDLQSDLKRILGTCDDERTFNVLTRAIELLANKGSFDPLIGTIEFSITGNYWIACPRDVKTVLRINISNQPAFARNRLYEYTQNGAGSQDGVEVGFQWHERGSSPIQDERPFPCPVKYRVTNALDEGKTITVNGIDTGGHTRVETLIGAITNPTPSVYTYGEIQSIVREETRSECYLMSATGSGNNLGRYYRDETNPSYRIIKLSQTGVTARMLYRKHVFKVTGWDDIIPLDSAFAIIYACQAVSKMMDPNKFDEGQAILEQATKFLQEEQASRNEASTLAETLEDSTASNTNINTQDVLIVADIYDNACKIMGTIGRQKVYDRITDAVEALQNKAQWDSCLGECTVERSQNWEEGTENGRRYRNGYFVLPRYVQSVVSLNFKGHPSMPRNRWFEYHLNGPGSQRGSDSQTWTDGGDVCTINAFPRDRDGVIIPFRLLAIPNNALDVDKEVRIYGTELDSSGKEVEVWRNNQKGWLCPVKNTSYSFPTDTPKFQRIDRITKPTTTDFVRLWAKFVDTSLDDLLMGYWYPDEKEIRYRLLKVPNCETQRIRIRYRKRSCKVSTPYDVLNLRSRLAVENMLRSLKAQETDPNAAATFEALAIGYLQDEQRASNPHPEGGLQIARGTSICVPGNIM